MSENVVLFPAPETGLPAEILEYVTEQDYQCVMIVGVGKDGSISTHWSGASLSELNFMTDIAKAQFVGMALDK